MTPRCPMHWGVKKFDPLKIQNGPLYLGVVTLRRPIHRGVETPRCPMYRGVVFCFFEPSSPRNSLERNTHSKNCLIVALSIQIHFIHVWKIHLAQEFWVDSPVSQAPGSLFESWISTWKNKKIKWPYDISNGTRRSRLVNCPFKGTGTQDLIWLKVVSLERSWWVGLTEDL